MPFNSMLARDFIQLQPQVFVLDLVLPTTRFPRVDPACDSLAQVFGICVELHFARLFQLSQSFDRGLQLHAVIRCRELTSRELFSNSAVLEPCRPTAGAWISEASAVCVDSHFLQG
jgi:hypothetical protein